MPATPLPPDDDIDYSDAPPMAAELSAQAVVGPYTESLRILRARRTTTADPPEERNAV